MAMKKELLSLDLPESYKDADIRWLDDMNIQCKGVKLRLTRGFNIETSNDEVITLFKQPIFIRNYIDQLDGLKVDSMVEVGVWDGGSAIFFWNLLKPKKMCCIELKKRVEKLSGYIEREQLSDKFRIHLGVDQADRESLNSIMEKEYSDSPLDLVIDDASHLYSPSRATFETLFPRLRPGGLYILEDWKANLLFTHLGGEASADFPPFHQLVHELLDVSMRAPDVISAVKCYHNFVVLERGTETIGEAFDIGSYLAQAPKE
jgi:hypothetical protein